MCRNPVGLGAMRTLTLMRLGYARGSAGAAALIFGAHCNGGVKKALDRAIEIGADGVQLFAQSPRTWHFPEHAPDDLARCRKRLEDGELRSVLVHALYLCNFAAPDEVIYGKSVATLRSTVDAACKLGAEGVVVHVGSHLG